MGRIPQGHRKGLGICKAGRDLLRNQFCPHLDLGCPASRIMNALPSFANLRLKERRVLFVLAQILVQNHLAPCAWVEHHDIWQKTAIHFIGDWMQRMRGRGRDWRNTPGDLLTPAGLIPPEISSTIQNSTTSRRTDFRDIKHTSHKRGNRFLLSRK